MAKRKTTRGKTTVKKSGHKFDPDQVYQDALSYAADPNVFFIEDLQAKIGISHGRFYDFFPSGSEKLEAIKKALNENVVNKKTGIRSKLYNLGQSAGLISLYKLIGTDEERRRLSTSFHDHTTKGKAIQSLLPEGTTEAEMIKIMESRIEDLKQHTKEMEGDE